MRNSDTLYKCIGFKVTETTMDVEGLGQDENWYVWEECFVHLINYKWDWLVPLILQASAFLKQILALERLNLLI